VVRNPIQKQVPEQWRCKICKFANPTWEEQAENQQEPKQLVEKCKRCREPKQILIENNGNPVATGQIRMAPARPSLQQ